MTIYWIAFSNSIVWTWNFSFLVLFTFFKFSVIFLCFQKNTFKLSYDIDRVYAPSWLTFTVQCNSTQFSSPLSFSGLQFLSLSFSFSKCAEQSWLLAIWQNPERKQKRQTRVCLLTMVTTAQQKPYYKAHVIFLFKGPNMFQAKPKDELVCCYFEQNWSKLFSQVLNNFKLLLVQSNYVIGRFHFEALPSLM